MPYLPYWFHEAEDGVHCPNLERLDNLEETLILEEMKWQEFHELALLKLHYEDQVPYETFRELEDWS
jgi:hypothetical protein